MFQKEKINFLVPIIVYKHFVILLHRKSVLFPELSKNSSFLRLTSTVLNGLLQRRAQCIKIDGACTYNIRPITEKAFYT